MSAESFLGRTITGLEEVHGNLLLLRLDDGTAVEVAIEGYDDELVVTHVTEEVVAQRAITAERERRVNEEYRRRLAEAAEKKRVHIAQMRKQLDPEAFEKWRRETYPTLNESLKDVWTGPLVAEQFQAG